MSQRFRSHVHSPRSGRIRAFLFHQGGCSNRNTRRITASIHYFSKATFIDDDDRFRKQLVMFHGDHLSIYIITASENKKDGEVD